MRFLFFKKYAKLTTSKPIKRKVSPSLVSRIITGRRFQNTTSSHRFYVVMLYTYKMVSGFSHQTNFSIPPFLSIDIFIRFALSPLRSPIDWVFIYIHGVENFAWQFSSWPASPTTLPCSVLFYDISIFLRLQLTAPSVMWISFGIEKR